MQKHKLSSKEEEIHRRKMNGHRPNSHKLRKHSHHQPNNSQQKICVKPRIGTIATTTTEVTQLA